MSNVFKIPAKQCDPDLISELTALLKEAKQGHVQGVSYISHRSDGAHRHSIIGSYALAPQDAYMPMCKAVLSLACDLVRTGADKRI